MAVRARSELYSWLAAALHIPDDMIVGVEFAEAGQMAWRELFPGSPCAALDALELANREASRTPKAIAARLEAVQREYARLFLGPPHALIHPYESCYFGEDRLMTEQTVAVDAFLKEFGVVPDPMGAREPVDHIAVELEFLAIVCAGELATQESALVSSGARTGESAAAPAPEEIENRFLREHLGQWGQPVAYDIRAATEEPMYVAAAEMLGRILDHLPDNPA